MLAVTVQGGTNAGRRIVKPLTQWRHFCDATEGRPLVTTRLYSCPLGCGARRPDGDQG